MFKDSRLDGAIELFRYLLIRHSFASLRSVATKAAAVVGKGKASGKKLMKEEVMPSPHGIRVAPRIPDELRKKAAQAVAAKDRKEGKVIK